MRVRDFLEREFSIPDTLSIISYRVIATGISTRFDTKRSKLVGTEFILDDVRNLVARNHCDNFQSCFPHVSDVYRHNMPSKSIFIVLWLSSVAPKMSLAHSLSLCRFLFRIFRNASVTKSGSGPTTRLWYFVTWSRSLGSI